MAGRPPDASQPGFAVPAQQAGSGLIGTLAGFAVFIVLLLIATQVLFDLYARSAVTAAAYDAARRVAGFDVITLPPDALAQEELNAEAGARQTLGRYGDLTRFTWTVTATDVELRVRVTSPTLIPSALSHSFGIDTIDRTVHVRAERLICDTTPCRTSLLR